MKKLIFAFGLFAATLRLGAVTPSPYTVSTGFSVNLTGCQGGGGTVTFYGEGTQSVGSSTNAGESPTQWVLVRPGKKYSVNYSGALIGIWNNGQYYFSATYKLSFISASSGYTVYINGLPVNQCGGSISAVQSGNYLSFNYSYTVELRSITDESAVPAGSFSGISLGKSVSWEVGLGALRTGRGAGRIMFREVDLTTNTPDSRARLYFSAPPNYQQITTVYDGNGYLRQLMAPQTLVELHHRRQRFSVADHSGGLSRCEPAHDHPDRGKHGSGLGFGTHQRFRFIRHLRLDVARRRWLDLAPHEDE